MNISNSGKIKKGYFSQACTDMIKNDCESEVFTGYYHVELAHNLAVKQHMPKDDINKLSRLIANKYIWIYFK